MLVNYSTNPVKRVGGIIYHNLARLLIFLAIATIAYLQLKTHEWYGWTMVMLPVVPVTIMGGALAIFLGFRNNSAYDRWWEARKIWGGIVNYSRSFSMMVLAFGQGRHSLDGIDEATANAWKREMIMRHVGWLHALSMHLRKRYKWEKLDDYLSAEDIEEVMRDSNKPTQIMNIQGRRLQDAYNIGLIDDFRHMKVTDTLVEFYNLQGMAERIKNTVFPYYYNYYTRLFLWVFLICLPFALVEQMDWQVIPMSVAISFVFSILEKSGLITESPFENAAADTPIDTITRAIEIDLMEMLGNENIPEPFPVCTGKFGVVYQK